MVLSKRIQKLSELILSLQSTTSLTAKKAFIKELDPELQDDFNYILEILAGEHKLGYTFSWPDDFPIYAQDHFESMTFREFIKPLFKPVEEGNLTTTNILDAEAMCSMYADFISPVVNRTLRLGIGKSILPKDGIAPMLAHKYDGSFRGNVSDIYVTEKLDGNRCIAHFDGNDWVYVSRNGKQKFNLDFNMEGLDPSYVYDGEIVSENQAYCSDQLYNHIVYGTNAVKYNNEFNETSGKINRKDKQSGLVYKVFDIMTDDKYSERRRILDNMKVESNNVKILPVLARYDTISDFTTGVDKLVNVVTGLGAEGLMINVGNAPYVHKRNYNLLKYKKFKRIDMKIVDVIEGTGKYVDKCGSLYCEAISEDGTKIVCNVGSGLSDQERDLIWKYQDVMKGAIVEVEYFELSQNSTTNGTKIYSMRFPRLINFRSDKDDTSTD